MQGTDAQCGSEDHRHGGDQEHEGNQGEQRRRSADERPQLLARVHPENARTERDMTCHVFPLPVDGTTPATLRAHCGFEIAPGQAQRLEKIDGMPCTVCLMTSMLSN